MARSKVVREDGGGRRVSLPVIDCASGQTPENKPHSGMGRWRAGVLIAVHLVIAAHVVHWVLSGRTLSPVEPSESMETLEQGVLNAGFIFFALAIVSTLIFGRYFCGWGCHVVALQDLCGWFMKKLGVRPKPFRSRLLMFVPLILALYMFVWPSFKRVALGPALEAAGLDWPIWLRPVGDIEHFESELLVEDFWATFPDWYIAVPFLAICGFATVYFLGAKGFCTYGCPYGGFFAPAEKVAPFRIRVTDACAHCGHCTAVCTSNVRVHEEVRDFGMVVDPGCMKCMDCISACPNDALYAGWGAWGVRAKPRSEAARETAKDAAARRSRRWDLSWGEEIALAVVFLLAFMGSRGAGDKVPMLLAGGVAGVVTFIAWMAWKTIRAQNARIYGFKLKYKGRVRPAGVVVVLMTLVIAASLTWAGQARFSRWRGDTIFGSVDVQFMTALRPEFQASAGVETQAREAIAWYRAAASPADGGRGWTLDAERRVRIAYFLALLGEHEEALAELERAIEEGSPTDSLIVQAQQEARAAGATVEELMALDRRALELHPELHGVRDRLARAALANGNTDEAERLWGDGEALVEGDVNGMLTLARFRAVQGRADEAVSLAEAAADEALHGHGRDHSGAIAAAETLISFGMRERGREVLDEVTGSGRVTASTLVHAAGALERGGWTADARDLVERALAMPGVRPGVRSEAALAIARAGDVERAARMLAEVGGELDDRPWEQSAIGQRLLEVGLATGNAKAIEDGVALVGRAADARPESGTLRHDYGAALLAANRAEEGAAALVRAAELSDRNAEVAARAAQVLQALGRAGEAAEWREEAQRRATAD